MDTGLTAATIQYLKTRIRDLTDCEKLVSLMLDEVSSAKRIEYQNGKFCGLQSSGATKTLLCFMIKSVARQYRDIVCLVPLTSISAEVINCWYQKVLKSVTEVGFKVVITLADAHTANRQFFKEELCGGDLRNHIDHPYLPGAKIFLSFDSVHVFINIYNNLLNHWQFQCPPFEGEALSACFEHVKDLFKKEMGQSVKYALKLTDKVLAPQPIERTKVLLADSFFHDSTINALEHFSGEHPSWKETARFMKLIR